VKGQSKGCPVAASTGISELEFLLSYDPEDIVYTGNARGWSERDRDRVTVFSQRGPGRTATAELEAWSVGIDIQRATPWKYLGRADAKRSRASRPRRDFVKHPVAAGVRDDRNVRLVALHVRSRSTNRLGHSGKRKRPHSKDRPNLPRQRKSRR
jgi:hypothetical protein